MESRPNPAQKLHEGLREISFLMGIIDSNCEDVKAIVNRLSEKYSLPKKTVRELASEYVLKSDFTTEPTVKDIEQRLSTIGGEPCE